jgi:hypothetical protein
LDVKLPENLVAEIRARAEIQGREPLAYVVDLLWRAVVELDPPTPKRGKSTRKTPVVSEGSDHDWSDVFRFGEPTESVPSVEALSRPVKRSDE